MKLKWVGGSVITNLKPIYEKQNLQQEGKVSTSNKTWADR